MTYGLYTILVNVLLAVIGISVALIGQPMKTYGVANTDEYFRGQCQLQIYLGLAIAAVIFCVCVILLKVELYLALFFSMSTFSYALYTFTRNVLVTRSKLVPMLLSDVVANLIRVVCLTLLIWDGSLSLSTAFIAGILGWSSPFVLYWIYSSAPTKRSSSIAKLMNQNWRFGRWLLLESGIFILSGQIFVYLTAWLLTLEDVAALGAVQLLINTLNVPISGIVHYLQPRLREELHSAGWAAWKYLLIFSGIFMVVCCTLLVLIISYFSEYLLESIFKAEYIHHAYLVPVLGTAMVMVAMTSIASITFRSVELPAIGLKAKAFAASVSCVLAIPLITHFGVLGAAFGICMNQAIQLFVYVLYMKKLLPQLQTSTFPSPQRV